MSSRPGAKAASYAQIGEECGTVFIIVPNGDITKSILFDEGGVASVRFTGTGLDLDKHICGQGRQFEFSTFLVDGKPVSETAYNAAWDAQDQKPDTVWYPWNEDNIRAFT